MDRFWMITAAALIGFAASSASAADLPLKAPKVIYAGPPASRASQPYFLVDQGPDLTGPGIRVTRLHIHHDHLRRNYPFVTSLDIAVAEARVAHTITDPTLDQMPEGIPASRGADQPR